MDESRDGLLGWPTGALIEHDERAPNLLRQVLRFSDLRRQAVFAAIAAELCEQRQGPTSIEGVDEDRRRTLATVMRDGCASVVIATAYGLVPQGFIGALERCGPRPLRAPHYRQLFSIFAARDRRKANALRHVGQITDQTIEIVDELNPILLDGKVVSRLDSGRQASDLNEAVAFVQRTCSRATDAGIENAIRNLQPHSRLGSIIGRWVNRADRLPPQPFPGDDELVPLATVDSVIWASRRYKNCMRQHLGGVLTGAIAFAEFRDSTILEFRPLCDGSWILRDLHAPGNGHVDPAERRAARNKCASLGIPHIADPTDCSGWKAVARMSGRWEWIVQ